MPDVFHNLWTLLTGHDTGIWQIVGLSLSTSIVALTLATAPGVILAYHITQWNRPWRTLGIWLAQAALCVPTVLIGLALYLSLSRQGFLGALHWLFEQPGLIAGQTLIAIPVIVALSISAIQSCDVRISETAIVLGAGYWRVMRCLLRECRFALLAAVIQAFARVISEVGCAMMVGGNIAGHTRTMTTAIAFETSKGDFAQGMALGAILLGLALIINAALMLLQGDIHSARRVAT